MNAYSYVPFVPGTWEHIYVYAYIFDAFFLLFCACSQFTLDIFIVHPPPQRVGM